MTETSEPTRRERLLAKARALPPVPGVYLLKDAAGVVLYVGKAARLPDRVASYFQPSADHGPKKQRMLDEVEDLEHLECESEWEALLTENRLIKDIRPRFNTDLIDDKTFPYLVVTTREDFPRILTTRNPTDPKLKGARIWGPFAAAGALREAVQHLQRVFKYRTCTLDIVEGDPKNRYFRPCLLYAIGQCTAPCADKIGKEAYKADIDRFTRFLNSKRSVLIKELEGEMARAADARRYEEAAKLRDQVTAIKRLDDRGDRRDAWQPETELSYVDPARGLRSLQKTLGIDKAIRCVEGIDIAHLGGGETVGSKVCFLDGRRLQERVPALPNQDRRQRRLRIHP